MNEDPSRQNSNPMRDNLQEKMQDVLDLHKKIQKKIDEENVHDLRVSIRRCRAMADSMTEVDPDPVWKSMKDEGKRLFKALGDIRDLHVMEGWIKQLAPENDPTAGCLLASLKKQQEKPEKKVNKAVENFDRKQWRKWSKELPERIDNKWLTEEVFECLALRRWSEAYQLHKHAAKTEDYADYHQVRIGVKRLRYIVENFLPRHHSKWGKDLKKVQDILGEMHDLVVLEEMLSDVNCGLEESENGRWHEILEQNRRERVEAYHGLTSSDHSLWKIWRAGLPSGDRLERASVAKLRVWACFSDSDFEQTELISQVALQIFDACERAGLLNQLETGESRRILQAAGYLHRIARSKKGKIHPRRARRSILKIPVPFGWEQEDLDRVALVVLFHAGKNEEQDYEKLNTQPESTRDEILCLAGILRLAASFQPAPGEALSFDGVHQSADRVVIEALSPGGNGEEPIELAEGKNLLEKALGRQIHFRKNAVSQAQIKH